LTQISKTNCLRLTGLWKDTDFLKLWGGQAISELGSRITRDGIPFAALLVLNATPVHMGYRAAVGSVPVLVGGLAAGVWVDRLRRRPVMIAADLLRAGILLSVPLAALLGRLSMGQLYLVIGGSALLGLLFDAAYVAYLPTLVTRENLLEGNSKLAVSESTAEILGPSLTGFLVQAITAPMAILPDALSYLISVISIALIRKPERPRAGAQHTSMWREAPSPECARPPTDRSYGHLPATRRSDGSLEDSCKRSITCLSFERWASAPVLVGLRVGLGGVGSLVGALASRPLARRIGLGKTLLGSSLTQSLPRMLLPAAALLPVAGPLFLGIGYPRLCRNRLRHQRGHCAARPDARCPCGAGNSTMNLVGAGLSPLGALAGGFLGEKLGVPAALLVSAVGPSWRMAGSSFRRFRAFAQPSISAHCRRPAAKQHSPEEPARDAHCQGGVRSAFKQEPNRMIPIAVLCCLPAENDG
jgi:predicted MFS family arabinose efflux permease